MVFEHTQSLPPVTQMGVNSDVFMGFVLKNDGLIFIGGVLYGVIALTITIAERFI